MPKEQPNGDCPSNQPSPDRRQAIPPSETVSADPVAPSRYSIPAAAIAIEGYDIIRELHHGGQGVVYQAIQKSTKRKVAIKLLLEGQYASKSARKRFEREIELVAQLKHPNIIAIFDSGVTNDGAQFYIMDYVRGHRLDEYVREKRLTLEDTLRLFATICVAVQYAHQRGVIHRDLKPSNVLVDAAGTPLILDFGLAKSLSAPVETIVSISQNVIGTLPYLSPEQACGNPDEIDTLTDVYALGVILYRLLTGNYPYPVMGQMADVLKHISETPPTAPSRVWTQDSGVTRCSSRRIRPGACPIDTEVQTIVLKTLAKERQRRYQSAGELARDIGHYLNSEPIEARRNSIWYVSRTLFKRHTTHIATAVIIGILAVTTIGLTIRQHHFSVEAAIAKRNTELSQIEWLLDSGEFAPARQKTVQLLSLDEFDVDAGLLHARALYHLGHFEDAESRLTRMLEWAPEQAAIYDLLSELYRQSNPQKAENLLATARRLHTGTARDYRLRALSATDAETAIDLLDKALNEHPNHFWAIMDRCSRNFHLGRYLEARVDAERARTLRPHSALAWRNLGSTLIELGEYERAVSALERSGTLWPDHGRTWYNLGSTLIKLGEYDRAVVALERATKLASNHAPTWHNLGEAHNELGESEKALAAYSQATTVDPEYARAWRGAAKIHYAQNRIAQALTAFRRAAALEPTVGVLDHIGWCGELLGDEKAALGAYDQLLELRPDHPHALNASAWIHLVAADRTLRDYDLALEHALKATRHRPDEPSYVGTLALAELRTGDYASASAHAQRALELGPDDAWSLTILCWAEASLGHAARAQEAWTQVDELIRKEDLSDKSLTLFLTELQSEFPMFSSQD